MNTTSYIKESPTRFKVLFDKKVINFLAVTSFAVALSNTIVKTFLSSRRSQILLIRHITIHSPIY